MLNVSIGFRYMMLAKDFCLMKPWCAHQTHQDMTRYVGENDRLLYNHMHFSVFRPLTDYFINTSHNTYKYDTLSICTFF